MTNTNVVIASPAAEDQMVLNTRIEETVQMSAYQIKKKLEFDRKSSKEEYDNLAKVLAKLRETSQVIRKRLQQEMRIYLEDKAWGILEEMEDYIDIGAEGTYYDDNRSETVDQTDIAKNIVEVDLPSCRATDLKFTKQVFVHGSINLFGNTSDSINRFEGEDCVFSPKKVCKQFPLTTEECAHFAEYYKTQDTQLSIDHHINELDTKLKNLASLTEDIRYAMLAEKAKANNDTTSLDLASRIADAYVNGIEPSTLLLSI